jgi:hypothetical protein
MEHTKLMTVPNPNRGGMIDRVIVIGETEDKQFVEGLCVDVLDRNPKLPKPFGAGYYYATMTWNFVGFLIFAGGAALSFYWRWWAFIPGCFVATAFWRNNRRSVGDFALQILKSNPSAYQHFKSAGLVWQARAEAPVPATSSG